MSRFRVGDIVICNDHNTTNMLAVVESVDTEREGEYDDGYLITRLGKGFETYFLDDEMRLATELEKALLL